MEILVQFVWGTKIPEKLVPRATWAVFFLNIFVTKILVTGNVILQLLVLICTVPEVDLVFAFFLDFELKSILFGGGDRDHVTCYLHMKGI